MDSTLHQSDKLIDQLTRRARELGFSYLGVTDPDVSKHVPFLDKWVKDGFQASMKWFDRHRNLRREPTALVPGTKRIVSVTLDYLPPGTDCLSVLNDPETAYISRYALGRDYHKLLRKRLKFLAEWFQTEVTPHGFRVFSDSAPVLEKHLAEKAGLGWIGKNTLLLSRRSGSWFFLGELFTDYPLPITNTSEIPRCGSCTACIDLCPTKAIVDAYRLDANRCISYLTIEHRGPIPQDLRIPIGNRIFGCDDCQLVCPWNRYAKAGDPEFVPRHGLDKVKLVELFEWSEEKFAKLTEGSPLRRAGYTKFLENVAIGLGNSEPTENSFKVLHARIGQYGDTLDDHICWALKRLASKRYKI